MASALPPPPEFKCLTGALRRGPSKDGGPAGAGGGEGKGRGLALAPRLDLRLARSFSKTSHCAAADGGVFAHSLQFKLSTSSTNVDLAVFVYR